MKGWRLKLFWIFFLWFNFKYQITPCLRVIFFFEYLTPPVNFFIFLSQKFTLLENLVFYSRLNSQKHIIFSFSENVDKSKLIIYTPGASVHENRDWYKVAFIYHQAILSRKWVRMSSFYGIIYTKNNNISKLILKNS